MELCRPELPIALTIGFGMLGDAPPGADGGGTGVAVGAAGGGVGLASACQVTPSNRAM